MGILTYSENIADAEAPPPLPASIYKCICIAASEVVSKSSGNPRLALTLQIRKDDLPVDYEGDSVTLSVNNLMTADTSQNRFRMKQYCAAFGVPMGRNIDPDDFVHKEARVETTIEPDLEGNPRANVRRVHPL